MFSQQISANTVAGMDLDTLRNEMDISKCIACHDDVEENWLKSGHSRSTGSAFRKAMLKETGKAGVRDKNRAAEKCLFCHAPVARNATDVFVENVLKDISDDTESANNSSSETMSLMNISCRVCHMMLGEIGVKIGGDIIYGPGWDAHEHSHKDEYGFDTLKSDYIVSSPFCLTCHNVCLSSSDNACAPYHETLDNRHKAPYRDQTCQSCHMKSNHSLDTSSQ